MHVTVCLYVGVGVWVCLCVSVRKCEWVLCECTMLSVTEKENEHSSRCHNNLKLYSLFVH